MLRCICHRPSDPSAWCARAAPRLISRYSIKSPNAKAPRLARSRTIRYAIRYRAQPQAHIMMSCPQTMLNGMTHPTRTSGMHNGGGSTALASSTFAFALARRSLSLTGSSTAHIAPRRKRHRPRAPSQVKSSQVKSSAPVRTCYAPTLAHMGAWACSHHTQQRENHHGPDDSS